MKTLITILLYLSVVLTHAVEPLRVGTEPEYPPFEYVNEDGELDGVSIRMAEALAASLGRPLEIESVKFDALILALKSGKIDCIISSMTANDERRKSIAFSDPYVTTGLAMLVGKDSTIETLEDLKKPGTRIVAKLGTTGELFARKELPQATITALPQDPACALEVAQGKADAWIYDQLSIFNHHKQHLKTTKALLSPLKAEQWAIGLRKGDEELRDQVNAFLKEFRADGGFARLGERYLGEEKELMESMGIPFIFDGELSPQPATTEAAQSETGGTLFAFLLVVGIAVGLLALVKLSAVPGWKESLPRNLIVSAIIIAVLAGACTFILASLNEGYTWNWAGIWARRALILEGWLLTIGISLASLFLCLVIGIALVVAGRSGIPPLAATARAYSELVRGTPLLVVLLVGYYVVGNAFGLDSKVWVGILLLGLFAGAYLAEVLRGGVESISATQFEAARAVGFDRYQTYRYVIVPQVVRRVLPAVAGLFIMLVKDSSLLSVIGTAEFTKQTDIARAATFTGLEGYLPLAVGYLLITLPLAWVAKKLEARFSYES